MTKTNLYQEVVEAASLGNILLRDTKFKITPEYYAHKNGSEVKHYFDTASEEIIYDEDESIIQGIFEFHVRVKKANKHLFELKSSYVIFYELSKRVDQKAARAFCEKVGLFSCYPFFRQHMSMISSDASAEMPILPLLKQSNIK